MEVKLKYLNLYLYFLNLQIKTITQYKSDFFIGLFSTIIGVLNIMIINFIIFSNLKTIIGFNIYEVFLIYGFFILVKGIDHFYNDNIWSFAWNKVKDGKFMEILCKPINPIFYIIMEKVNISGISEMIMGLIIVIFSMRVLHISLNLIEYVFLVILLMCGLIVIFSLKLLFSAPAFWTVSCGELMTAGVEISNTAKYPIDIYKNILVRKILLYILPFPIISYFPAIFCLKKTTNFGVLFNNISGYRILVYSIIITIIILYVSFKIWYMGLKRFEPTGT